MTKPDLATVRLKADVDELVRRRFTVGLSATLAFVACIVGAAIGIWTACRPKTVECAPDDFSETPCQSYPHAGQGLAIVLVSLVLAALVIISTIGVRLLIEARARELGV